MSGIVVRAGLRSCRAVAHIPPSRLPVTGNQDRNGRMGLIVNGEMCCGAIHYEDILGNVFEAFQN